MNINVSIEHDSSQIPIVAKTVCHLCVLADTELPPSKNMELAVVELLTNIINYSDGGSVNGRIDIGCRYTGGDFTVTVSEGGRALSARVVGLYTDSDISMPTADIKNIDDIPELPESGFGIQLIKSVCDEVSYKRLAQKNIYQLTFDLSSAAA